MKWKAERRIAGRGRGKGRQGATLRNYLSLVQKSRETKGGQDRVNNQAHRDLSYSRSGEDGRDRGVNFKQ